MRSAPPRATVRRGRTAPREPPVSGVPPACDGHAPPAARDRRQEPDLVTLADTPIDYLDFASPKPGLGGKLGIDATNKLPPETEREWGRPMAMDPAVSARIDALWPSLGLAPPPGASP